MTHSPEYRVWLGMRARCANPNSTSYQYYGAVGISVCDRWGSFGQFYEDMGPRPSPAHSIERVDVLGGYSPGNCVWALPQVQAGNKRNTRRIEFSGQIKTVTQWAATQGLSPNALYARVFVMRWPVEKALVTPVRAKRKNRGDARSASPPADRRVPRDSGCKNLTDLLRRVYLSKEDR